MRPEFLAKEGKPIFETPTSGFFRRNLQTVKHLQALSCGAVPELSFRFMKQPLALTKLQSHIKGCDNCYQLVAFMNLLLTLKDPLQATPRPPGIHVQPAKLSLNGKRKSRP